MTFSNVSARRPKRSGGDRSVLVIAFMMALVFVPVLAMHAAVLALGSSHSPFSISDRLEKITKLWS